MDEVGRRWERRLAICWPVADAGRCWSVADDGREGEFILGWVDSVGVFSWRNSSS